MAKIERVREVLTDPLSPEYLREKARAGWRAVAVEWQRGGEKGAAAELPEEEVPYGLRVAADGRHLIEDPAELEALTLMLAEIVDDQPLSSVAEELNRRDHRRRDGSRWTQVAVFNMLPRLIEVAPRIYASDEWSARKRRPVGAGR